MFYDESVVERAGAVPPPVAWLLFGRGAVHGLDDEAHARRKSLLLGQLGPGQVGQCAQTARAVLSSRVERWDGRPVDLHDELVLAYGSAVLRWVGWQVPPTREQAVSREYARIVAGFGFAGPRVYARAWLARLRTNRWARRLVADVRRGRRTAPEGSVLAALAASDLDDRTAAIELGNVVRPTTAVSWLGVHAAAALAELPASAVAGLAEPGADSARWSFAQEVRRTAPFVPMLAGRVRRPVTHAGIDLEVGDRVVLDVRGIDLDAGRHPDPLEFRPGRFEGEPPGAYELVPQGGGHPEGHRCPGESMTLQLLVQTVEVLAAAGVDVEAGEPDLGRIPTLPDVVVRGRVGAHP